MVSNLMTARSLEEWVKRVSKLPYLQRRREILRRIQPPQSRYLYKYRAINPDSEESIEWTRDILVRSRLWFSSPLDFNDPFDMGAKIVVRGSTKQRFARYANNSRLQGINRKTRRSMAKSFLTIPTAKFENNLSSYYNQSLKTLGVYSFAGDPRSILMWSHYASQHKGICIQFERARDYATFGYAVKVDYRTEYPTVDWVQGLSNELGKVFLRKFEDWKYEREERLIKPERAGTYLHFKPEAVTGIIYGCRVTEPVRASVEGLLAERRNQSAPDVKVYCAHKDSKTYSLYLRRIIDS